jgi:glycosyltransferase involved in cell wall biosynthesis
VLLVCGKDPIREAGVGHTTYVRAHALAAQRAGFEPHILSVSPDGGSERTEFGYLHRVRSPAPYVGQRGVGYRQALFWLHAPLLTRAAVRLAHRLRDPLVIHGFGPYGGVATAAARRVGAGAVPLANAYTTYLHERAGKQRGVSRRDGPRRRAWWWFEHRLNLWTSRPWEADGFRHARLVLLNYESVQRLIEAEYGRRSGYRLLPYTIDAAFLSPAPPRSGQRPGAVPVVVSVARHDPRKGLDFLIESFHRLARDGVKFRARMVGAGELIEQHRRRVSALGLGDRVEILGYVPDAAAELRAADVFVLPALEEGGGSVALIEALGAGLAVVASRIDGIPEDVTDGREGLLVPPGDVVALTGALRRLIEDAEVRLAMGARARQRFEAKFAPEPFVEALGAVYDEVWPASNGR